ncbi:hypothetical protein [Argonema galeatum]|uniref:hypothetical protein n=1 Tax=Argonema galeatum TaxID=2942762 RepID=UPI002010CF56|nr:hypothetical protein [Argonema galeatum]MCL1467911.1 hypothetical protein [Argonema galeatum A003/A1]
MPDSTLDLTFKRKTMLMTVIVPVAKKRQGWHVLALSCKRNTSLALLDRYMLLSWLSLLEESPGRQETFGAKFFVTNALPPQG